MRRFFVAFSIFLLFTLTGCFGISNQVKLYVSIQGNGSVIPASGLGYSKGTLVQLRPTPAMGWAFDRWEGTDGDSVFSNQILMDSTKSVTAVFRQLKYPVKVLYIGNGTVEISIKATSKDTQYNHGDVVELKAVPEDFYTFDHWEGALSGTSGTQELLVDSEKAVTAVFKSLLPSWGGLTVSPAKTATDIFRWSDITDLTPPKRFKVWLSRFGTERSEYQVEFVGTQEGTASDAGYRMIVCKGLGDFQIGHGDSGSPLLTSDNLVIGAVSKIFQDGDVINFKCTSIEDMLTIGSQGLHPKRLSAASDESPIYISGAAATEGSRFARSGIWRNRQISFVDPLAAKRLAKTADVPVKPLPGHTICINYLSGPINIYTTGTLTYEKSPGVYLALGHPDARTGERHLPVSLGYVFNISVPPGQTAVKECVPVGPPIGTLTRDEDYGVLIENSVEPETTPIKLIVKIGGDDPGSEYEFELARDYGSTNEYTSLLSALILQLEASLRYASSGHASGSLLLQREGAPEQLYNIDADSTTDILYAPNGLADQITSCVDQVYEKGRSFTKVILDITFM